MKIYYVLGNHDYWVRDFFKNEVGINIFPEHFETVLNNKKFFITHGDGISNDGTYRIFRKIMRNKINIFLYSLIHPDIGLKLADKVSKKSREHSSKRNYNDSEMINFAVKKIEDGFDYVVMGHSHMPKVVKISSGYYINTGDWLGNFTYGVFENEFQIKRWNF